MHGNSFSSAGPGTVATVWAHPCGASPGAIGTAADTSLRPEHPPARAGAMLLAAGRGERMRPLSDRVPKPLLCVQGQPLLHWHLQALARAGVARVLINTAWLGTQVSGHLGTTFVPPGAAGHPASTPLPAVALDYSHEGLDFGAALETAGGIARALPQLAPVFWLAAGDVYAPDFPFDPSTLHAFTASDRLAHLWLVPNPPQHPQGDFGLSPEGLALNLPAGDPAPRYTYSTLALLRAELFAQPWCDLPAGNPQGLAAPLAPLLRRAMDAGRVSAEIHAGRWTDVGTPERLQALNS